MVYTLYYGIVCQNEGVGVVCKYNKSSIWRYKVCKKKIYLQRQNM